MHPHDCPEWEYDKYPRRRELLAKRNVTMLARLRKGKMDTRKEAVDSRPFHAFFFAGLTPPEHGYYADHYRGEPFRCLRYHGVGIPGDPRVGYPPNHVLRSMRALAYAISDGINALDVLQRVPSTKTSPEDKLSTTVVFACKVFEEFLRIHPYVNGNGHAARFIMLVILIRYGYWPSQWPIEPRPPDPPYSELIEKYRDGDTRPLEAYILQQILGGGP